MGRKTIGSNIDSQMPITGRAVFKRYSDMKTKTKLIISGMSVLLLTTSIIAAQTYAWITTNRQINQLKLKAGEAEAKISGFMFKRKATGSVGEVDTSKILTATQTASTTGRLSYEFVDSQKILNTNFDLGTLYENEHALIALQIPTFYVEIQVFSTLEQAYLRPSLQVLPFKDGQSVNFGDFSYRYGIYDNNVSKPLTYAAPSNYANLKAKPLKRLIDIESNNLYLNEGAQTNNQFSLVTNSSNNTFYQTNFIKSIVVELSIDPITYVKFLYDSKQIHNNSFTYAINISINLEYSRTLME